MCPCPATKITIPTITATLINRMSYKILAQTLSLISHSIIGIGLSVMQQSYSSRQVTGLILGCGGLKLWNTSHHRSLRILYKGLSKCKVGQELDMSCSRVLVSQGKCWPTPGFQTHSEIAGRSTRTVNSQSKAIILSNHLWWKLLQQQQEQVIFHVHPDYLLDSLYQYVSYEGIVLGTKYHKDAFMCVECHDLNTHNIGAISTVPKHRSID